LIHNPWEAPFLYSDSRHAFYVTTNRLTTSFADSPRFGLAVPQPVPQDIPEIVTPQQPLADAPNVGFLIDSPGNLLLGAVEIAPEGRVGRPGAGNRTGRS